MITDYTNVHCPSMEDLDKEVGAMIRRGWVPQGGAFYAPSVEGYAQTMVKYKTSDCEFLA